MTKSSTFRTIKERNEFIIAKEGRMDQWRNIKQSETQCQTDSKYDEYSGIVNTSLENWLFEKKWPSKSHKNTILISKYKTAKLNWTKNHKKFRWSKVIFTDECNFELDQCRYGPVGNRMEQESSIYNLIVQVWDLYQPEVLSNPLFMKAA